MRLLAALTVTDFVVTDLVVTDLVVVNVAVHTFLKLRTFLK